MQTVVGAMLFLSRSKMTLFKEYLPSLSDSQKHLVIDKKVFAIDSTTIALFQPIFECMGRNPSNGQRKDGIKSHQKLDLQAGIPVKVYHSNAREHDSLFIQHEGVVNKNEIALFDKAYFFKIKDKRQI